MSVPNELFTTKLFGDANLQGYWRLEGNSNDAKNSNNGTDTAILYANNYGKFNKGAHFNGTTSYIDFGNVLNVASSGFSIGAWVYPLDFSTFGDIIAKGAYQDAGYLILIDNGTAPQDVVGAPGAGKIQFEVGAHWGFSKNPIPLNEWTQVTYVRSISGGNETNQIFINGIPDNFYTRTTQATTNNNHLMLGARDTGNGSVGLARDFIHGFIDDAFMFDRALSSTEVFQLAQGYKNYLGNYRATSGARLSFNA